MTTEMWTGRGYYDSKGVFKKNHPLPRAHAQSEDSDVERAGYRTLKQQIQELEDAGKLYNQMLADRYPGHIPPTEEPPIE